LPSVTLTNLQINENPVNNIWGNNPNHVIVSADIIINTTAKGEQQFSYEVRNSQNQVIAMAIFPRKIKPNKKENFKIGIDQPSKNVYFPDGNYLLNAWSVSTWTGRRFDWGSHTGIKEWERSSNIASISKSTKPPIVPTPVVVTPPPAMVEVQQQLADVQLLAQQNQQALLISAPEPVPVGNLNPYQLTTTINPKWILLAIVGVGILSAMIFILRGRK